MEEKDLNFNYSECVKNYDSWGTTHYVNICNGEEKDVPWGVGGWSLVIFLILCGIVVITLLISLIYQEIFW